MASKGAPVFIQRAMDSKERKPFTYTPGGLDLSEIKSEKMARRLMRNAMCPGVPETPKTPKVVYEGPTQKPPVNYYNLPVAVFPMIQIPQNPKELLRRTSGPNRRNSFDNDIPSPKVEFSSPKINADVPSPKIETESIVTPKEKPKTDLIAEKVEDISKSPEIKEKNELKLKDNKVLQENEVQVKKTVKVKKNKEKTGLKLKKKVSGAGKLNKTNDTIIKITEEKRISTIEFAICDKVIKKESEQLKRDCIDFDDFNNVSETKSCKKEIEIYECLQDDIENATTPTNESIVTNNEEIKYESEVEKTEDPIRRIESRVEDTFNEDVIKDVICDEKVITEKIEIESANTEVVTDTENHDKSDEGDVTPKVDILTHQFEPVLCKNLADTKASNQLNHTKTKICNEISSNNSSFESFRRENSSQIASRRKPENIKSLSNDLDNVPSLNLCSKRFSFLRESPSKDDPFSILTGISARLTERSERKRSLLEESFESENTLISDTSDTDIPKYDTCKLLNNETSPIPKPCGINNDSFGKVNGDVTSPLFLSEDVLDYSKKWSSPKLFNDFSCNKIEENIPAWKRELMEIANQKKERNEESEHYKEEVEPPWRRELRELAHSRILKESAPSYNVWNKITKVVESSKTEEPQMLPNPVWSQTLKPKTWRERKADLSTEKESDVPDWKNATILRRNFMNSVINKSTSSSSSCSSPAREVGKMPEILIEITGQPLPAQEQRPLLNYTNPWESSSESSTTFSPEPSYTYERTPTPQSRSSPSTQNSYPIHSGLQSPVVAREYGTVNYQPNRMHQRRSCPIQSKSFKYLQMLTGTSDGFEDDEPFIPHPPQHSHLRPENV